MPHKSNIHRTPVLGSTEGCKILVTNSVPRVSNRETEVSAFGKDPAILSTQGNNCLSQPQIPSSI